MVLLGLACARSAPTLEVMVTPEPRPGEQSSDTVGKLRYGAGSCPDRGMLRPSCTKNALGRVVAEPCRCEVLVEMDSLADGS